MAEPTPHLLFVDDEPALRALMAERLAERGFEVVEAESGEKALESARSVRLRHRHHRPADAGHRRRRA